MTSNTAKTTPPAYDIDAPDAFTRAYMECSLWSSTDESGINLDDMHDLQDIAPDTYAQMIVDCVKFQGENMRMLQAAYKRGNRINGEEYTASNAGHDFWLTRNNHGAGFWDRGIGESGNTLTKACEAFGNVDLCIGDDGKIHAKTKYIPKVFCKGSPSLNKPEYYLKWPNGETTYMPDEKTACIYRDALLLHNKIRIFTREL